MTQWQLIAVVLAILSPWVGMITLVVIQARHAERLRLLEYEVRALRDVLNGLTQDLGWKKE